MFNRNALQREKRLRGIAGEKIRHVLSGYGFGDSGKDRTAAFGKIIAERGREGFLLLEEEVGAALSMNNTVLAPGGSICYGKRAMEHLRETSLVIFLDVPFSEVEKRTVPGEKRGGDSPMALP